MGRESLEALVLLDLEVEGIVVILSFLRSFRLGNLKWEFRGTMKEKRRKLKEIIFIMKKKRTIQYLQLTNGVN